MEKKGEIGKGRKGIGSERKVIKRGERERERE
jgi:hypothetical protein